MSLLQNCRLCGSFKQADDIVCDLKDFEGDNVCLSDYVRHYCRVALKADEGLTTKVCRVCRLQVELFVSFCDNLRKIEEAICETSETQAIPKSKEALSKEGNVKMEGLDSKEQALTPITSMKYKKSKSAMKNVIDLFQNTLELSYEEQEPFAHVTVDVALVNVDGEVSENWLKMYKVTTWDMFEYNCLHCDIQFMSFKSLLSHFKDALVPKIKIACNDCDKPFFAVNSYINHVVKVHHEHLGFCCIDCSKIFYNVAALIKHYDRDHPKIMHIFPCIECCHYAQNLTQLKMHVSSHKVQELTDDEIGEAKKPAADAPSTSYEQRIYHPKAFKGNNPPQDGCLPRRKTYPCNLCNRILLTNQGWLYHKRVHENSKPFVCDSCTQAFRSKQARDEHKKSHN